MASGRDDLEGRCRACQVRLVKDPERARKFSAEHPECECSRVSISEHSPGCVEDDERLARFVVDPKHLNADGTIEVGFFRDAHGNGLSLSRRRHISDNELYERGQKYLEGMQGREDISAQRENRDPRALSLGGLIHFEARRVREHEVDGERRFCVMDSAADDDRCHADIIFSGEFSKKSQYSRLRVKSYGKPLSARLSRVRKHPLLSISRKRASAQAVCV